MSNLNDHKHQRDANYSDEHSQSKTNDQSGSSSDDENKPIESATQRDPVRDVLLNNDQTVAQSPNIKRGLDQSPSNDHSGSNDQSVSKSGSNDQSDSNDHSPSNDQSGGDDRSASNDQSGGDDQSVSNDHSVSNDQLVSNDQYDSNDHSASNDQSGGDDQSVSNDQSASNDQSGGDDQSVSNDQSASNDQSGGDDQSVCNDQSGSNVQSGGDDQSVCNDQSGSNVQSASNDQSVCNDQSPSNDQSGSNVQSGSNDQSPSNDQSGRHHPTEKVGISTDDKVTIITRRVIEHAYDRGDHEIVRKVLYARRATVVIDVLQYLHVSAVCRLLSWAVDAGDIGFVLTLLLRAYNDKTQKIETAEMTKIMSIIDDHAICRLVRSGCDLNAMNAHGRSLLWYASFIGKCDVVSALIHEGANVNARDNKGCSALLGASETDNTLVVQQLLDHNADANQASNIVGVTPLYAASSNNRFEVVRLLLNHKAAVNQALSDGSTPLSVASQEGHIQVVELLLANNADVNKAKSGGSIPLYVASQNGRAQVVQLLLRHKADVNSLNDSEHSPLSAACYHGDLNIVKNLIEYNANIYHQNIYCVTPFAVACAACRYDVVEYLLQYENIVQSTSLGHSPLHGSIFLNKEEVKLYIDLDCIPCESKWNNELKVIKPKIISDEPNIANIPIANRCRVVKLLLESGCIKNINDRTEAGETALFLACTQGYTEIVEMLYKAGGDITMANYVGCSPLSTAIIHVRLDTVKWLLTCPEIDIDVKDCAGCTPLYRASELNRLECVKVLLEKGCDVNITDNELVSPLAIACKSGHTDIVAAIFEYSETTLCIVNKEGVSVLDFACEGGEYDIVKFLLDQGIDPTTADVNGNTALHRACQYLRLECVDELLKRIRDVNKVNRLGESPLMMIPYSRSKVEFQKQRILTLIEHLLDAGAKVNLGDYKGYTPLFQACENNSISVASMFLDHGAYIDARDRLGRSILHAAVISTTNLPSQSMMDWIIEHGVDVNHQDCNSMTALHLAVICDKKDIISYLVSRESDLLLRDKFGIAPVDHMTKFPETFRLFMPQIKMRCSRELARVSYWWRTFSDSGIKKELEDVCGCLVDLPAGPQLPSEKMSTTVRELGCWKEIHFHNDAKSLFKLLEKYGCVTETDMAKTVIDRLDSFISAVAEQISPNAGFTPVKAGSLSEGTKAMQPDEGDYILQQRVVSIQDFDLPEAYTNAADFGRLRVKRERISQIKEKHPHLITELDGSGEFFLDRNGLFQNSYRYVGEVLNEPEFWKQFPMLCRLSCKDVCPDDVTIRHLDLIYSDKNYAWMPLDVDMVPAIDSPHWHPSWCTKDEFCQKLLRKNGCRFIAKWAIGAHEDPTRFRISFEKCEKELFHTMPMSFKKAYQLGKILKSLSPKVLKLTNKTDDDKNIEELQWLEGISSFITSYHMKTTIFGLYQEYCLEEPDHKPQSPEFDIEQVICYTRQMFTRLTESYKTQKLLNFWLPGENLLIDAKYGQYGWCASNYARLLSWMLEPGTEVPQFLTSKQHTQPPARSQSNQ